MCSEKDLNKIIDNSITIADSAFDSYNTTKKRSKGLLALKGYNTALRAIAFKLTK